ncbi:MAG TPA: hypothetical protein VMT29_19085 [Steroidobacteraceae bacterium]|nr:hypothetical protein [Steroidobacteraceae bacterium]
MNRIGQVCVRIIPLCVACASLSPARAATADACAVITPEQLSAAVGVAMDEGKYVTPGFTRTCTWVPKGGATPTIKFFTLYLQTSVDFDTGKGLAQMAAASRPNSSFGQLSGVGDDAYVVNFGGSIISLLARKSGAAIKLTWYGATQPDKVLTAEKNLAARILPQL